MRLGTVLYDGRERVVADLGGGRMLDLHLAAEHAGENEAWFVDMLAVIYGGDEALAIARSLIDAAPEAATLLTGEVTFCPPIRIASRLISNPSFMSIPHFPAPAACLTSPPPRRPPETRRNSATPRAAGPCAG